MSGPATPSPQAPRPGPPPFPERAVPGHAGTPPADLADRLAGLPVAEHAAVLEAEHQRLHRQLATIDQL